MKIRSVIWSILCVLSSFLYSQDYVLIHDWLGTGSDWNNKGCLTKVG